MKGMTINMEIEICGIKFSNPITLASGPAGNGQEISEYLDLNLLGGFTSKTVTYYPLEGNPPPRIVDVYGGIINSIGLQNSGMEKFIQNDLNFLLGLRTNIIVSISSNIPYELYKMIEQLNEKNIQMIEINFSCPNVEKGRAPIESNPKFIYETIYSCKKITKKPLIVKFGPHSNVLEFCKAAIDGGIDALALINCPQGMKIDILTGNAILKRKYGGFAGPAIKPIAIATIYKVRTAFREIPIIGMGGVIDHEDVIEMIMAGANLVGIGFGIMVDPLSPIKILKNLDGWLSRENKNINDIFSIAHK